MKYALIIVLLLTGCATAYRDSRGNPPSAAFEKKCEYDANVASAPYEFYSGKYMSRVSTRIYMDALRKCYHSHGYKIKGN